jgi:hypothetical protein
MKYFHKSILVILFFLTACGPNSLEDFRAEGEGITRSLIKEFNKIHTRDELLAATPKIKRLFQDLVDVIIHAQEFKDRHPQAESLPLNLENHLLSEQLREELNRIYRIEGGQGIVEKAQTGALNSLDAFEQRRTKKMSYPNL